MFRKLVSNLSFSPALITQVSFYAHRLRQEEITRRLTVLFVVLALVVQSLAVLSPPESANASSEQDLIRGGVINLEDLLMRYDKNTDDIQDIYTTLGLERVDIETAQFGTFNTKDDIYSLSRYGQYSTEQGETSFSYKRSGGGTGIRFISPLSLADTSATKQRNGTTYEAWIGQSEKVGWFALMKASASVATKGFPTTVTPDSGTATSSVVKNISTLNVTQGQQASAVAAKPFDKISYTLSAQNTGQKTAQVPLSVNLADALEYAALIDDGGGTLNPDTKNLSWPTDNIKPGTSQERTFVLQLASTIPATPSGSSNSNSFDCVMSTTFGSNSKINVDCPVAKGVENIINDMPPTGTFVNIGFAVIILATALYFYLRTRQMKKEIRLIRHNINTGTI